MTPSSLPPELRSAADGLYALEAATGLIIAHGTWLAGWSPGSAGLVIVRLSVVAPTTGPSVCLC